MIKKNAVGKAQSFRIPVPGMFGALLLVLLAAAGAAVVSVDWAPVFHFCREWYGMLTDRGTIRRAIASYGGLAPLVFVFIQVLQVVFAPIPGEVTGFVGGYIFGLWQSFFLSSAALTLGSWINFSLGRFLGERYVRRLVPERHLIRFDGIVKRQGVLVILVFFIFPGFPKDYLCLLLGVSRLPLKAFMLLAAFGRMPGTLLLSAQGTLVYAENYWIFWVVTAFCLVTVGAAYRYRERMYGWVEKMNGEKSTQ